jgi:hypothetical protein
MNFVLDICAQFFVVVSQCFSRFINDVSGCSYIEASASKFNYNGAHVFSPNIYSC